MLLLPWMLGTWTVWRWASELGGARAGLAATVLWCFSPMVMGWSATICPDSVAASLGIAAFYFVRVWLRDQDFSSTIIAGLMLGIALLSKTTWLVIYPLIPLLAVLFRESRNRRVFGQLAIITCTCLLVINCGYAFQRTGTRLGDFTFFSTTLAGRVEEGHLRSLIAADGGNRFAGTLLGELPVPLPGSMIEGIDLQKRDFEEGKWCYLRGWHKYRGWWYWYAYALLVKTPCGSLILILAAVVWQTGCLVSRTTRRVCPDRLQTLRRRFADARIPALREQTLLLLPPIAVAALVCSQTGFTRYLRYLLPCFPFAIIWVSQLFSDRLSQRLIKSTAWALLCWSTVASVWNFPHSVSFFNQLAGGAENGPLHLIDAEIDWGQDILMLADWAEEHSDATPLYVSVDAFFDPHTTGMEYEPAATDPRFAPLKTPAGETRRGIQPGWYAVSVNHLYAKQRNFAYLFDFPIHELIGYSIYVFHLQQNEVDEWNAVHLQDNRVRYRDGEFRVRVSPRIAPGDSATR